mgnify:CR=1 FL=1
MRIQKPRRIKYVVILFLAMLYGMISTEFQLIPYPQFKAGYAKSKKMVWPGTPTETPKEYFETDVDKLISMRQSPDVERLRDELIAYLWGAPGLPSTLPVIVSQGHIDNRYNDIRSLTRINKFIIKMEFGLESHVYHFIPKYPNKKLMLYHQGHDGDFYKGKKQIGKLLDNGYSVLAFSMPLLGLNNQPVIRLPKLGKLKLVTHDHMKYLRPENGSPVKYFIEPIVIMLNYIEKNDSFLSVSMLGLSGGGWTTTLVAAIDTRIGKSFPVAGSYPIYLRSNSQRDWGDYEQNTERLYQTVNYLELYVLGASGSDRKQLQIINQYDSCCFAGRKWETYRDIVRNRVSVLGGGEFDLFLDNSHHEHLVSNTVMALILDELDNISP